MPVHPAPRPRVPRPRQRRAGAARRWWSSRSCVPAVPHDHARDHRVRASRSTPSSRSTSRAATRRSRPPRAAMRPARTAWCCAPSSGTSPRRPTGRRIGRVEIFRADRNGNLLGSATIYARDGGSTTCDFAGGASVTVPTRCRRTATRKPTGATSSPAAGRIAPSTRSASGSRYTHVWVTPLAQVRGRQSGRLLVRPLQRDPHGAGPVRPPRARGRPERPSEIGG